MDNKFFISSNVGYTPQQVAFIKKDNYYLFRAFSHLVRTIKKGEEVGGSYRPALFSGELPSDTSGVKIQSNRVAEKVKRLMLELTGKDGAKRQEFFLQSHFTIKVLESLFSGYIADSKAFWSNYKPVPGIEAELASKKAIEGAIFIKRYDPNAPIGFNWYNAIDTFATFDINGKFVLNGGAPPRWDELALAQAVQKELVLIKSNPRFKKNYHNDIAPNALY